MLSLVVHLPLILFFCVFVLGIYFIINTQFAIQWQDVKQMTLANLMLGIGPLLLVYAIYWLAEKIVGSEVTWLIKIMRAPFQLVYIIAMHIVLPFLVTIPIWIYLQTVNRLFLKLGEVKSTEVKLDELKRV